jgi:hypothetical protein
MIIKFDSRTLNVFLYWQFKLKTGALLKLLPIEIFVGVVEKNYSTIKDVVLNLNLTVVTALEAAAALVHGVPGRI